MVSAGLAGMFLLAFFSRRANRQGLWVGLICALLFTAWATITGGNTGIAGPQWSYSWPSVMIGVIAHVIVLVVGYLASLFFPPDQNVKTEWTMQGWLAMRRNLTAASALPLATQSNP
jgi:SSS family solute:Na+ symporter